MLKKFLPLLFLPLVTWNLNAQGPPTRIAISAPQTRLISGQTLQLSAVARDNAGARRTGDSFDWNSNNSSILSVDSNGVVTARRLGIALITATLSMPNSNLRASVRIQVLPLRINVRPRTAQLSIGERLQYSSEALDINENPIPDTPFRWRVNGADGNQTQAAGIAQDTGLLTARAIGKLTVLASFNYGGPQGQIVNQVSGQASLELRPRREFQLNRLLATEEIGASFRLRTLESWISANENGQVAFVANLDGLTSALLLYENGAIKLLASAGTPGPFRGTTITGFGSALINGRGEVLAQVASRGGGRGGGLLLADASGTSFLLTDGVSGPGFRNMGGNFLSRQSFNDRREVLFTSSFQPPKSDVYQQGLFRYSEGNTDLLFASNIPLPGLTPPLSFHQNFGIDHSGTAYFAAYSRTSWGVYRQQGFSSPAKVILAGESLAGSTVQDLENFVITPEGDLVLSLRLRNQNRFAVRYSGSEPPRQVEVIALNGNAGLQSASDAGILFYGDFGRGWGLHQWRNGRFSPLLMQGRIAPNGELVSWIDTALITARGKIFAQMRTNENTLLVAQLGTSAATLFQSGTSIDVVASLNSFSIVGEGNSGSLFLVNSGNNGLFELDSRGLIPRLLPGDRLPQGGFFGGVGSGSIRKQRPGVLYFLSSNRISRFANDAVDTVVNFPFTAADGVQVQQPYMLAVNASGTLAWVANVFNQTNQIWIYLTEAGRHTLLASNGAEGAQNFGGIDFERIHELAIDDLGRVMVGVGVALRPGTDAYYLYEAGRWQKVMQVNSTRIAGRTIAGVGRLKAAGNRFYSLMGLFGIGGGLAEYRDQWLPVIAPEEPTPDGNILNNVGDYDVNSRGEVALLANLQGSQAMMFRSGSGELRFVHSLGQPTEAGDLFSEFIWEIYLSDDRRLFFAGLDLNDRYLLYAADPLF